MPNIRHHAQIHTMLIFKQCANVQTPCQTPYPMLGKHSNMLETMLYSVQGLQSAALSLSAAVSLSAALSLLGNVFCQIWQQSQSNENVTCLFRSSCFPRGLWGCESQPGSLQGDGLCPAFLLLCLLSHGGRLCIGQALLQLAVQLSLSLCLRLCLSSCCNCRLLICFDLHSMCEAFSVMAMMFGDQCKVMLSKGQVLGIYLKDGCNNRRACVLIEHESTCIQTAAIMFAAATILQGVQEHIRK